MSVPIVFLAVNCFFGLHAAAEGQVANVIISAVGAGFAVWWLWMEIRR